jgi:hypothetical protein
MGSEEPGSGWLVGWLGCSLACLSGLQGKDQVGSLVLADEPRITSQMARKAFFPMPSLDLKGPLRSIRASVHSPRSLSRREIVDPR